MASTGRWPVGLGAPPKPHPTFKVRITTSPQTTQTTQTTLQTHLSAPIAPLRFESLSPSVQTNPVGSPNPAPRRLQPPGFTQANKGNERNWSSEVRPQTPKCQRPGEGQEASRTGGCARLRASLWSAAALTIPGWRCACPGLIYRARLGRPTMGSTGRWPVGFGGPPKPGSALFTPNPDPLPVKGRGNARRRTV